MSAKLGPTASFVSIALLVGLIPAQEKTKTVDELRKENAALRQQVKTLRAQRDAKTARASKKTQKAVRISVARFLKGAEVKAAAGRLDLVLKPGTEFSYFRSAGFETKAPAGVLAAYRTSLGALTQAKRKLDRAKSPTEARVIVDEVERALLDVRRELWKLEQAEKKKAKNPAKKSGNKQSDSAVVRVEVPVLAVPIRLDLKWPVLSEATDPKDQLFFSFRRF